MKTNNTLPLKEDNQRINSPQKTINNTNRKRKKEEKKKINFFFKKKNLSDQIVGRNEKEMQWNEDKNTSKEKIEEIEDIDEHKKPKDGIIETKKLNLKSSRESVEKNSKNKKNDFDPTDDNRNFYQFSVKLKSLKLKNRVLDRFRCYLKREKGLNKINEEFFVDKSNILKFSKEYIDHICQQKITVKTKREYTNNYLIILNSLNDQKNLPINKTNLKLTIGIVKDILEDALAYNHQLSEEKLLKKISASFNLKFDVNQEKTDLLANSNSNQIKKASEDEENEDHFASPTPFSNQCDQPLTLSQELVQIEKDLMELIRLKEMLEKNIKK